MTQPHDSNINDTDGESDDDETDREGVISMLAKRGMGRNSAKHPGRGIGTPNKSSRLIKHAIQRRGMKLINRLFALSRRVDGPTSIAAIRLLLAYGYGRPTFHVEVSGELRRSYVMEMPPSLEHEEWMQSIASTMQGSASPHVVNPVTSGNGNGNGNGNTGGQKIHRT